MKAERGKGTPEEIGTHAAACLVEKEFKLRKDWIHTETRTTLVTQDTKAEESKSYPGLPTVYTAITLLLQVSA